MPKHDHLHTLPISERYPDRRWHMMNVMAKRHENQRRKLSGEHYIAHTFGVMELASMVTDDEDILIAALGHDLVEDTDMTFEKIREKFGTRVAHIIWGVTKDDTLPDWRTRNEAYLARLSDESQTEEGSVVVALADKIYNISDMIDNHRRFGPSMWVKFKADAADQVWWYESVLAIGERRVPDSELNTMLQELIEVFRSEVVSSELNQVDSPTESRVNEAYAV